MNGCALLQLIEDLDEFKLLVPQAGLRLNIKAVVRKVYTLLILWYPYIFKSVMIGSLGPWPSLPPRSTCMLKFINI